jgi:ABC-type multidrug transport system fused ATPase/permease subunit
VLGETYPLLDIFWTMLEIFLFVIWIFILFQIFIDIFRDHGMKGWEKAVWVIVLILLPFLGALIYLIARGGGMHERALKAAQAQQKAFDQYVKQTAGSGGSTADQLKTLADLKEKGAISEQEFEAQKQKILAAG